MAYLYYAIWLLSFVPFNPLRGDNMKAARSKKKLWKEATVDLRDVGTAFLWTHNGFRCIESPNIEIEVPTDKFVYGQSVGVRSRSREDTIETLKKGLPVSSFEKLHKGMDISSSDLARITKIAVRTLQRRKKEGRFQTDESERLLRVGIVFDKAIEVLGSKDAARNWMKTPKKPLADRTPLEYCDTEPGAREVEDLLGRIEHGVFS